MREFRWHVIARSIVTGFLALAGVVGHLLGYVSTLWPLLGICGILLLYNAVFYLTPWRTTRPRAVTMACLVFDVFALTGYLHFSGDIENPLILAYSLPVIAGAVLLSRQAGFALAALASFLFITLILMTVLDAFPIHVDHHRLALVGDLDLIRKIDPDDNQQGWNYILTHLLILTAVLFGSAQGFGALSEELRKKEQDLNHENERLLLLLSILPEGVVLLGKNGTVLHANPTAAQLLGGAIGRTIQDLDPALGLANRFSGFAGSVEEFEFTYRERILDHVLARRSPGGPVVWVFRDMTEQRRLMAQIVHRSKMIDLGLLAAGIAHEIGNPLSSISALLEISEMKRPNGDISERDRILASHVDRIGQIVQDVTGFARPSAGKRTPSDLRLLVEKALEIFRFHKKAKEIQIERAFPEAPVRAVVVEDQIIQVVLNLLLNAADASSGRGAVGVSIDSSDKEVRVSVADHGVGISEEDKRHLFAPFFTTKEQGMGVGLGLFISESIIHAHGGRIEVHSANGIGSTFTICLPIVQAALRHSHKGPLS